MTTWYRVFTAAESAPLPELLSDWWRQRDAKGTVAIVGDDLGWYQARFVVPGNDETIELDRYLTREDAIRPELNSWAGWLESIEDNEHTDGLMQDIVGAKQLFTIQRTPHDAPACLHLCRWLAGRVEGIYQVDGQGFFAADGTLLVQED
jgi:hypothetical protein